MRLGVSPAAAPTPTGAFTQRFEALFPCTGALGCEVCFAPRRLSRFICARVWGFGVLPAALPALLSTTLSLALSVYLCANVGPQGLLVVRLPSPFVPHSASLGPATATRVLSTQVPVSAPPTGLDECLFFISLVSDFPCLSICCQFWLCDEAQCVYLHRHLGSLREALFFISRVLS